MSKSRKDVWGDPFEMESEPAGEHSSWQPFEEEEPTKYLEEAHEALSRFVNHTKKRGKPTRAARKGEAWQ